MLEKYKYSKEDLTNLINGYQSFYAHLSKDESKKETLIEHILLVQDYFFEFIKQHKLEKIIFKLIFGVSNNTSLQHFIAELFVKSVAIHDFGKVNPIFQRDKMKNERLEFFRHKLSSGHSTISGYIFTLITEKIAEKYKFKKEMEIFTDYLCILFSYPILKHHSPSLNNIRNDISYDLKLKDLSKFTNYFKILKDKKFVEEMNENLFENINLILDYIAKYDDYIVDKFALFSLVKLNYSLLTAADYIATIHFMDNWSEKPSNFGTLDIKLKTKIINKMETSIHYNREIYRDLNKMNLEFPINKSYDNLNKLRKNLAVEIINGIRKNIKKNLFYIEAPTGSGKTNLSLLTLTEFLRKDIETKKENITKVFYVFPFTTLITQTFKTIKETLDLNDNELIQIHSKSGFSIQHSDDKYGKERINIIDYLFMNYPIALLSHVKFFNILKSSGKIENYLLHRLANSLVIIDELQAYTPKEWDKIVYFINKYAKYFNIKFVLMSATLPKIDKLLSNEEEKLNFDKEEFVKLTQNKNKYFQNPNFTKRVEFDFSMLNDNFNKDNKEEYLVKILEKLIEESEYYRSNSNHKVHTIIEFIFKKTADKFMKIASDRNILFDEIFLLSGTILEPRKKEIIAKLKSNEYKDKNILLITTQVVEAGVDIDMDLGFKDISIIDSDEQLAGRINRNVKKTNNKLFLFNYDEERIIYGDDYRYKIIKEKLKFEDYHNILQEKDFDRLYSLVMKYISEFNEQEAFSDNLPNFLKEIKKLNFKSIDNNFEIIRNSFETISLFIPIKIPIKIPNSNEKNFSFAELDFLRKTGKYNDEKFVDGAKIWKLYCEIIENEYQEFSKKQLELIILQGLISNFSFSISIHSNQMEQLIHSGDCELKYGFYKINNPEKYYDYKTGFKDLDFEDIYIW